MSIYKIKPSDNIIVADKGYMIANYPEGNYIKLPDPPSPPPAAIISPLATSASAQQSISTINIIIEAMKTARIIA